jgi:CBS domain-containing protein/uncharacterized protein (DUF2267 family)
MSLKWYRRQRLVALNPTTPVLDAARAFEKNSIGCVVVQDKGRVAGIVTDRDIAVRVVGRGLDPNTTLLEEVMTSPVATLSLADSQDDAIRLMQELNVRRIPLVEGERLAGMVTLDDLLLDEAAPLEALAAVVEAQIGEGGPAASARAPGMQRRVARAEATYRRLINQVREEAGLDTVDDAQAGLEIVVGSLVRRLTPGEAKDFIAQLPSLMQPTLSRLLPGPDLLINKEAIEEEIAQRLNVNRARAAQIVAAVVATVAQSVSPGQVKDIQSQLPQDLRELFPEATPV